MTIVIMIIVVVMIIVAIMIVLVIMITVAIMIIVEITIMIMTYVGGKTAHLSMPARRKATRRRMYGKYCVNLNALRRRAKISAYNNW